MDDVAPYLGGLWQRDRLQVTGEAPGAVVESNEGQKSSECYVKRYFGDGKGAALEI